MTVSVDEDVTTFLKALTRPPQLKVLASLAERPTQEFTKTEIATRSGIGRTTLYRIWEDLEKMKAIRASRQVGAVTLYCLNAGSPIVQSLLSVREKLARIQAGVEKIEGLQEAEKIREVPQEQIPLSPAILLRLLDMNASTPERAVSEEALGLKDPEKRVLLGLAEAGLVEKRNEAYLLTSLGKVTAEGAARLWRCEAGAPINETISSLKVALGIVSQEIKKIGRELSEERRSSTRRR